MFSFEPQVCIPRTDDLFAMNFSVSCKIFASDEMRDKIASLLLTTLDETSDTVVTQDTFAGYTLGELSMYWMQSHLDGLQPRQHGDDVS